MKAKILEVDFSNDTAVIKFEGDYSIRNVEYQIFETSFLDDMNLKLKDLTSYNHELEDRAKKLLDENTKL